MESKSRLGKKTSKHPKDLRETRRSQNSQEPKDQSELGGAVSDHTRSSRSRTKEKAVPEETKTRTKHTNKKKKSQEKDLDDYDDYMTDIESASRFGGDDDLDSDEEEEEEKSEEAKELDQEDPNADYCTICKDQKRTMKSVRHSKVHSSSAYVSDLMKNFYQKSSDPEKISCSKCSKQVLFEFPRTDPLNHLMQHHLKEFSGHEKEFLKQLNFFTMIRKNNKKFNSIVDKFPFNHQKFTAFLEIYYADNTPNNVKKRDLLLGQMSLELQSLLISEGFDAKPKQATQKLIDNYEKHQKLSKSKQNTKTESNGNTSEKNKSRSLSNKAERNGTNLNEDEEDDDNPGFKPKQIGLGKREMTNPSQGDARGKKVKTEQGDLDEETKLKAKIADLYMKLEEKDEEISRLKKLLSKK